jgi:hypothetical protein
MRSKPTIRPGYPVAPVIIKRPRAKRRDLEGPIQAAIVEFLDLNFPEDGDVFWSATLNGVRVPVSIRKRLKAQGLRGGLFDIIIVPLEGHPLVGETFHVEVKSDEGSFSKEQRRIFKALKPFGRAALCRSVNDVQTYLLSQNFQLRARL